MKATDLTTWKCPVCKRVVQILACRTSVICVGGWITTAEGSLMPKHEVTRCYQVPEAEGDPLELAHAMGIMKEVKL